MTLRRTVAALAAALSYFLLCTGALAAPPGFFGIVPQGPLTSADYSRMAAAGVETLRFELSWELANPSPGVYDWTASDTVVAGAAEAGIRPLAFLYETPDWIVALDGRECALSCAPEAPRGPAALEAWRAFAEAAARRYGPGGDFWAEHPDLATRPIRVWQIWNEQNSPTYFSPRPSPRRYAAMLGLAHDAIAAVDPGTKVILGGMFGTPRGGRGSSIAARRFLARLYRRDAAPDFDGVAAHPYAPTLSGVLEQIERIRAAMARAGDDATRLWITELGWASHGPASALNRGPRGQAQRLRHSFRRLLAERRRLRIASVDWYSWRDRPAGAGDLCVWCPGSGLVDVNLGPKPALAAFATLAGGH